MGGDSRASLLATLTSPQQEAPSGQQWTSRALLIPSQWLSQFMVRFAVSLVQQDQANRCARPCQASPPSGAGGAELPRAHRAAAQPPGAGEANALLETLRVLSFAGLISSVPHVLAQTRWPRLTDTQSPRRLYGECFQVTILVL